jgi:peptidoglycan/LPS O-acetylase OafA/YrhL
MAIHYDAKDSSGKRIAALDSARGLAIVLVVIFHFLYSHICDGWLKVIVGPFGLAGVTLFFMLSGFLIERHLARDANLIRYFSRRLFRIYPAYLVAIPVILAVEHITTGTNHWSPTQIVANALIIQDILNAPLMLGVFWTLLIEIKFYALAPFVKRAPPIVLRIAPYATIAANFGVLLMRGEASNLLTYITFCFVGMHFGLWVRSEMSALALGILVAVSAVSAFAFTNYFAFGLAIFVVLDAAILALALKQPVNVPPLPFLGRVSYSWYLYHAAIGFPLIATISSLLPVEKGAVFVAVSTAVIVSLVTSWVSFILIERPVIAFGHQCEGFLMAIKSQ